MKAEEKVEQEAFLKLSKKRHRSKGKGIFIDDNKGKKIDDTSISVTKVIDITEQKEEIRIS